MASWIVYAILARFFSANVNIIDQYVARLFGERSILSLMIFQNMLLIVPVVLIGLVFGLPVDMTQGDFLWVALGLILAIAAEPFYFRALQRDEARNAIPLFELVPIMLMVLAFLFLGETMGIAQILLALIVIAGGFVFLWDFEKSHFHTGTFLLMLAASACYGGYQLCLRLADTAISPVHVMWLLDLGFVLFGLVMLPFHRRGIPDMRRAMETNGLRLVGLQLLGHSFGRAAIFCLAAGLSMAPAAGYFAAMSGTQPVFVFLIGALLGMILPHHYVRLAWNKDTICKAVTLIVMVAATALLHLAAPQGG